MAFLPRSLQDVEVLGRDESGVGIRLGYYVTTEDSGARESLGCFWLDKDEPITFTLPPEPGPDGLTKQETFFVVEGEVAVTSEGQDYVASARTAVYFPPGGTYTLVGRSDVPSFVLFFVSPAVK